jgi:glucose-1-phosphate cytidylyltransferase
MKAVILAGGLGTRISEESILKPKPMIEIGGKPILWHIMKIYSFYGVNEFIICCGYKGYLIKEYFLNYFYHTSDVTINLQKNEIQIHRQTSENWKVSLVDTGENTMTGGRIKKVRSYLDDETFFLTYGDGLADVDLTLLLNHHKKQNKLATITGVLPPGRFGALKIDGDSVIGFQEKPKGDNSIINGGFFVLETKAIDYIDNDLTLWEKDPLERLALSGQLNVYKHSGFWQPMDTLREKNYLEELWSSNQAPWKLWD